MSDQPKLLHKISKSATVCSLKIIPQLQRYHIFAYSSKKFVESTFKKYYYFHLWELKNNHCTLQWKGREVNHMVHFVNNHDCP